jgi:UDP-glucose 4-epimerase
MTYLITGGSGFIGSHLVEALQGRGSIRVLDNLRTGFRKNLDGFEVEFHEGSVLDQTLLAKVMEGVDYVFHLAAMVSVPESVANPRECEEINGFGLLNVLEAATAAGVRKVFFASSAAVYGDNPTVPKVETMIPEPKSPYAFTKLLGEHYCRFFHDEGRVKTACLRFFNVFGPRQDPKGPYAAAVAIFMARALQGEPILIHGDGEQTRDFIYVKDIVAAIMHVTLNDEITGVFNAGYGGSVTLNEIAEFIVAQAGTGTEVQHGPVRAGDVRHSRAAVDLLAGTGFKPISSLKQGLATMLTAAHSKE